MYITSNKKTNELPIVRRPLIVTILAAIAAMAAISSFLIYTSQLNTADQVQLVASQNSRKAIVMDTLDAATETQSALDELGNSLQAAANSGKISSDNTDEINSLMKVIQSGSKYSPDILLIDSNGILKQTTDGQLSRNIGQDVSLKEYFKQPKVTNAVYISNEFQSGNSSSIAVAVPITSSNNTFRGVLAAIVPLSMVQNDIKIYFLNGGDQGFLVVSTDGKIITSVNTIPIMGPSVFDSQFLNVFTSGTKDVAAESFRLMTQGKSGIFEFTKQSDGQSGLMAYEPVKFMGNNYWTLASTSQLQDAKLFTTALQNQGIFILVAVILIGAVAAIFAVLIIIFNRRLRKVVQEQDLRIHEQLNDLQKAYGKLIEQDMLKDEFINIAAHELRTPVLPIILSAEGLAEDIGTGDPKVDIILRNAKRINKLTNDILDVSRIESNTFKLQKDKVDLKQLVTESIEDTILKMQDSKRASVKIVLDSKLPKEVKEISIDRGRINQVMLNLLDNAVNFTDKGKITVTIEQSGSAPELVEVRVVDEGKGIDETLRPRLFQKFATKSNRATGTGLGLYLSKAIIVSHGGEIWAESNKGGVGATFSFTLPIK